VLYYGIGMAFFGNIFPKDNAHGAPSVSSSASMDRSRLEAILGLLEDGIVVYDQNFTVLFFNPMAERIFGVKAASVVGKTIQPKDADRPEMHLLVQVMFPSLAPVMVPRSGAGAWPQIVDLSFAETGLELRTTTSAFREGGSGGAGFLKVIRDRTREITLLRTKSDFVTVASHQLKTPLTEVNWALEALSADAGLSDANKELVKQAAAAGKLLVRIVEDLLNTARIEEGRFGYQFQETDIVAFLNGILNQALPQARRAGVTLYFDPPQSPLPPATIDPQKLSLVVTNLLDNAIRYNVKNGQVTVAAKTVSGKPYMEISVKDTGIGIPADQVEKLFGKFFRADNAVKFQTEGTGLGLYIAQNIVRAHGGEMHAESELNRGSKFSFTLPTDPNLVPKGELPMEG
jgi:two-component system sensor histidine kinase VicK